MTREEAAAVLESDAEYLYSQDEPYNMEAYRLAIQALKSEPKHGRWDGDTCSVCGFSWCDVTYEAPQTEMSFCPNCGARMDEVEE